MKAPLPCGKAWLYPRAEQQPPQAGGFALGGCLRGAGGHREGEREEFGSGSLDVPACTGPGAGCRLGLETTFLIKREFGFTGVRGSMGRRNQVVLPGPSGRSRAQSRAAEAARPRDSDHRGRGLAGGAERAGTQRAPRTVPGESRGEGAPRAPHQLCVGRGRCGGSSGCPGGLLVALRGGSPPVWPGRQRSRTIRAERAVNEEEGKTNDASSK